MKLVGSHFSKVALVSMLVGACDNDPGKMLNPGGNDASGNQLDGAVFDVATDPSPALDAPFNLDTSTDTMGGDAEDAKANTDAMCYLRDQVADAAVPATSQVLYSNNFETPNTPLLVACGNALDARGINFLYGSPAFQFTQVNTVEGVVLADPAALYKNPSGQGGKYALGMLSNLQNDKLALTFAVTGKPFLNVGFDLSAIDVSGCGGPFGVAVPVMNVSLYESQGAAHNFAAPGKLLAEGTVTGTASPDAWTFNWKYGVVSLDATQATTSHVSVVFDLIQSGYAAFDNLSIVASGTTEVVDRNNDGIADDVVLCPAADAGL
mgnify:CR=1 FL=1